MTLIASVIIDNHIEKRKHYRWIHGIGRHYFSLSQFFKSRRLQKKKQRGEEALKRQRCCEEKRSRCCICGVNKQERILSNSQGRGKEKEKEIFTGQVVVRHAESLGNQYKISLRSSSRPRRSFPTVRNSENREEEMIVFGDGTGTQKQRKYE